MSDIRKVLILDHRDIKTLAKHKYAELAYTTDAMLDLWSEIVDQILEEQQFYIVPCYWYIRRKTMLTRKHFKELASILEEHKANGVLIRDIADFCYQSNSNFDRARFYDACGLEL